MPKKKEEFFKLYTQLSVLRNRLSRFFTNFFHYTGKFYEIFMWIEVDKERILKKRCYGFRLYN